MRAFSDTSANTLRLARAVRRIIALLGTLLFLCAGSEQVLAQSAHGSLAPQSSDAAVEWAPETFAVICYHDIRDDVLERPDTYTVQTQQLALQFAWLRENGYHVVSLGDVIAARSGKGHLPPRAVVLTFDDGLKSVYSRAFPLLKAFHYPAVVGLVGTWLDDPSAPVKVQYGPGAVPSRDFLSSPEIGEMQASGLIEFASHTYDLHHGVPANPQGNLEPSAISRQFDPAKNVYEPASAVGARVASDLRDNSATIARLTGRAPRAIVWPYGAYNQSAADIAAQLGMPYGFTLEDGFNTPDIALGRMRRILVTHDVSTRDFAWALQSAHRPEPTRVMQVDLDYVYDIDPNQQEQNLSRLLDRVKAMGVNTVYLQAYADPNGTGSAHALYFPNRHLPMRSDLFNRVAWQLRTRTGVAVYAWLPVLAFALPDSDRAIDRVAASEAGKGGDVVRLSPFDPKARAAITEIYEDLASYGDFQGLLFSDDATLNAFEDSTPDALATYRSWGLPPDIAAIRADPNLAMLWAQKKTGYLTQFTLQLVAAVRLQHNDVQTARNLFATAIDDASGEREFAQSMTDALAAYDHVALMAMPYLEGEAEHPDQWLRTLVLAVAKRPGGLTKTIFELQSVDWTRQGRPVSDTTLAQQMRVLHSAGARNFGYYPDDFIQGTPRITVIRPVLSAHAFPGSD